MFLCYSYTVFIAFSALQDRNGSNIIQKHIHMNFFPHLSLNHQDYSWLSNSTECIQKIVEVDTLKENTINNDNFTIQISED